MSVSKAYLAIDAHARHCVLGYMDGRGRYIQDWRFSTSESELIRHVVNIEAGKKYLTLEEGPMAFWIAQTLRGYVQAVTILSAIRTALKPLGTGAFQGL